MAKSKLDTSISAAEAIQKRLASEVILTDKLDNVKQIAGVDVAYSKEDNFLVAGAVVLNASSLELQPRNPSNSAACCRQNR